MNIKEIKTYKTTLKLTKEQREIIIGLLLGDGHLETQNQGQTYRLKIEQSIKHREYVDHLYNIFHEWVLTLPKIRTVFSHGRYSNNYRFQTISHSAFRFYAHQFYQNNRKCVPKLIHRFITPKSIAYWFMDDGSIKSKESKGIIFNTQGYEKRDVSILIKMLNRQFGLEAKLRKQKDGYQIYISGESYERFCNLVKPYLIKAMEYKLPLSRRT